jgi:hypothetical protein
VPFKFKFYTNTQLFSSILTKFGVFLKRNKSIFGHQNALSLGLAIELQNQNSLTIQLSIPFIFGHSAFLLCGFADMDDTWCRAHMSSLFFPISPLSSLSPYTGSHTARGWGWVLRWRRPARSGAGAPTSPRPIERSARPAPPHPAAQRRCHLDARPNPPWMPTWPPPLADRRCVHPA